MGSPSAELIIVLLIIGILAMTGMAGFGSWFAKGRVDGAVPSLFRSA